LAVCDVAERRRGLGHPLKMGHTANPNAPSPAATAGAGTVVYPFAVCDMAERGRGLVALTAIEPYELIARFTAYNHTLYDEPGRSENCTEAPLPDLCHSCLGWGSQLPVRCTGCASTFCSESCRGTAMFQGHGLCCAALGRIGAMRKGGKFSDHERSTACYLLRAFARRVACDGAESSGRQEPGDGGVWMLESSFADVAGQCQEAECTGAADEKSEETHRRIIKLATLHARKLVDEAAALRLLRAELCNSFHLYDTDERVRGSVMYPQASLLNHSCHPNCAAVATGNALQLVTLRAVRAGEELTYCYLRSFREQGRETLDTWGFTCSCARCSGEVDLVRFDTEHRCACGKIVVAAKAALARASGLCHCHSHNRVGPAEAAADAPVACA